MGNREKLLAKAEGLFARRGYDATSVQEIVDEAGVTKPTLYHYFESKQGLLEALLEKKYPLLMEPLRQAANYRGDINRSLREIAGVFFAFARSEPVFNRLQLGLWFAPGASEGYGAALRYIEEQRELLERFFLSAVKDHGNMRGRHRTYAMTFLGMIHTCIHLSLNGQAELNQELLERSVHQFMHGIFS